MVAGTDLLLPFAVVTALWFVSTGLVAMINHRLRQSFGRAAVIAGLCGIGGLSLLFAVSQSSAIWAVYASFFAGLMIWSWHEISFLTGAVAGTHRTPLPAGVSGWPRFTMATMALIHHEVAIAMTAAMLLSLAALSSNPVGAYVFGLLAIFRLSSKLNIFHGVPNLSDEMLPGHLDYLKSYFGPPRLSPMLILTTAAILTLAALFGWVAFDADTTNRAASAWLLCCLCLLAALEHIFLAVPFRDSRLWQWALGEPAYKTRR
jgi:putative photosynthetic complex assembly protein 2